MARNANERARTFRQALDEDRVMVADKEPPKIRRLLDSPSKRMKKEMVFVSKLDTSARRGGRATSPTTMRPGPPETSERKNGKNSRKERC